MIVRVVLGVFAFAFVAMVRRKRRRARHDAAASRSTITVRSGYAGDENPIYRVAIERGGPPGTATFTWSRDGERDAARHADAVQTGTWIALANGPDVCFEGTLFRAGDFWTFAARSAADTVTLRARRRGSKPSARGRATRPR